MGIARKDIVGLVKKALIEDLGWPYNDKTSECLNLTGPASAEIILKEEAVVCGIEFAKECFKALRGDVNFQTLVPDGGHGQKNQSIASVQGPADMILSAERTALNFLQRLSGIATLTAAFVRVCENNDVKVLDTRKTTPTLRVLEKYAVKCGGGINHRFGLYDQVLIKDNHIKVGGIEKTVKTALQNCNAEQILLEVDTLEQLKVAYALGINRFLLDNMSVEDMSTASKSYPDAYLEASGGLKLDNIEEVSACGIDAVSIGSLTHSARAIDISLELL